ncbi:MAG TPA: hypothetical protein VHK47_02445 [Polyangia bacterium]|jgi:hypothetical protein|nr:hypothetical protein [Polyangia bacterium]
MNDLDFRRACVVSVLGIAVELGAALRWTPATFVLAAAVGTPLVLAGSVMFLRAVWRFMKERGAA